MTHFLAISVGPVQEFIAAARRTRDLWFGSHLLSEVSRAVAKAVEKHGKLIFPESSKADNVANVILVELNAGADPRDIVAEAKKDAKNCWLKFAEEARGVASGVIHTDIWNDQVQDVIEFYAAWVTRSSDYRADRARVMRLLAGRKNCRDFLAARGRAGVPKSSLDGQRESVLLQPPRSVDRKTFRENWPKSLRLSSGEELDVVGVTKRLSKKQGESNPGYPSVARVAAETWLQGVKEKAAFKELRSACAAVTGLNKVAEPKYDYFPYEGTAIFKDRHTDLIDELGEAVREPLQRVAEALKYLGGEPSPYLAVLVADGDKMGEAISGLDSPTKHREFSQALAGFADEARRIRPIPLEQGEGVDFLLDGLEPVRLTKEQAEDDFKPKAIPAWWPLQSYVEWLTADIIERVPEWFNNKFLSNAKAETRDHVCLDADTGAAAEGQIFATAGLNVTHLPKFGVNAGDKNAHFNERFAEITLSVRITIPERGFEQVENLNNWHPLGGERRLVHWQRSEAADLWICPKPVQAVLGGAKQIREGDGNILATNGWLNPVSDSLQDRNDGFGLAVWGTW